tara:strand:+ start:13499 stop:13660 length:162 start_codon:yes stop_codon:yes gene_type:complete
LKLQIVGDGKFNVGIDRERPDLSLKGCADPERSGEKEATPKKAMDSRINTTKK